ncbi:MAG TPA: MlaD family protein [Dissulfurispiraceae bacterium]
MFDVKKQYVWSKLKVGIVLTTAIVLILLAVFFAGGIEHLLVPKADIQARIKDVRGLRKGAPVWVSGIEIGYVKDMSLNPEYGTLVVMSIDRNALKYIKKDSVANIITMGLLGDKYVELSNGTSAAGPISPGDTIKGRAQPDIKDLVDTSTESLGKATEFIDKLGHFIEEIQKSEGVIGKLIKDPELYRDLRDSTVSLNRILGDFRKSQGTVKKLIEDPSLYNKLSAASSSMEEFSRKMNQGTGTLKRLAEDPALYDNLNRASQQLNAVLQEIDSGKGAAGALIKDKQLAVEVREAVAGLKETVEELKSLTKDIKANPRKYFKFSLF